MIDDIEIRRVDIQPFDCLSKAKDLIGEQFWLFVGIGAMYVLASQVPFGILIGPFLVGAALCFFEREKGRAVEFNLLFKGYDKFVPSLIASLIYVGVIMFMVFTWYAAFLITLFGSAAVNDGEPDALVLIVALGGMALLFLGILLVMPFFTFIYPLIAERNLGGLEAVKVSARAAAKNYLGVFGFWLVCGAIYIVATLMCFFPLFLVLPIILGAVNVAYRKVFGDAPAEPLEA